MKIFEKLFEQYSQEKGFTPNSKGSLWNSCLNKFNLYSEWYKHVMTYEFFKKNIINNGNS